MTNAFESVNQLPFADGQFPVVLTEFIHFELPNQQPVTLIPVHDPSSLPEALLIILQREFNIVVEEGLTYPYHTPKPLPEFISYWFEHFVAVLVEGHIVPNDFANIPDEEWDNVFLGNFYIKPNYPGRCSHICNAGFIVSKTKRGLGLGTVMGKKYLELAPKLGYVYSVFNLVFETNAASMKIWDNLGFERIGYVKNAAVLRNHNTLVGAYMYGKDLVD